MAATRSPKKKRRDRPELLVARGQDLGPVDDPQAGHQVERQEEGRREGVHLEPGRDAPEGEVQARRRTAEEGMHPADHRQQGTEDAQDQAPPVLALRDQGEQRHPHPAACGGEDQDDVEHQHSTPWVRTTPDPRQAHAS